eukprot:CAMPEP_0204648558 /NCGR_PEP_ID=MMETSP0718-20130828/8026_1 /ASSEMBLY_ACC=CAM_ASM_000674 /TAXON_ID=230516 /ORGANISM="Chaetoceros curvisetus" /LENGTH=377 /DNA_ID=CAMNT_0051671427 /DNA_START=47 /DNA_END=1180 /DNA_ORIENTATION=+
MGNILPLKKPTTTASLLQPCISGNIDEVKSLIGSHIAAQNDSYDSNDNDNGNKSILQSFVNEADGQGNTALIGAAFGGHLHIIQFLINDCGADISIQNHIGCNAIWIAAGYGHIDILKYLIRKVKENIVGGDEHGLNVLSQANSSGDTPLLAAVSKGHTEVVETILTHDNDDDSNDAWTLLTTENKAGDTPLSVAVGMGFEGPMLNFLLDTEDSLYESLTSSQTNQNNNDDDDRISRPLHSKNAKGLTPLLVACERNFKSITEELMKRGADPLQTDEKGRTPLAIASFCGCMDVAEYLLSLKSEKSMDYNKYLNQWDINGCTPLWLAARTGNAKMVKVLIEAGADDTIEDNDNLSPRAVATKFQKKSVEEYFNNTKI